MAVKHLMELIVFLVILWLVWFFTGGPQRYDNDKPYVTPANNIGDTPQPTYR